MIARQKLRNRAFVVALLACALIPLFPAAALAASAPNVTYHTQQEIRSYFKANAICLSEPTANSETPNCVSPYKIGAVSNGSMKTALKTVNFIRYVAGLDANVTLDSSYSKLCQTGSLVNAANDQLSHFPTMPANMSNSMYADGRKGCSSSNLFCTSAYGNLPYSIVNGYLDDSDAYNIDALGHRRWLLNPYLGKTGFGAIVNANNNGMFRGWCSMYVMDYSNEGATQSNVAWPAQNTPVELFNYGEAWSLSVGDYVEPATAKVTVKRNSDNTTWNFSSSRADGDFYVNNQGYAESGCIIFRPSGLSVKAGDSFTVSVSGIEEPVEYTVSFFSLAPGTWKKSGGKWWFSYDSVTQKETKKAYPKNQWLLIGKYYYHFDKSGYLQTGWQKFGKKWYYLDYDGAMYSGWTSIGNAWYLLGTDGAMKTGWGQDVDGTWYHFASSGAMHTGWQKVGKKWYYLGASGAMVSSKWVGNYYLQADGSMATSKWVDGGKYYVGKDGAWVKGKSE